MNCPDDPRLHQSKATPKASRGFRIGFIGFVLCGSFLVCGSFLACGSRPQAPALRTSPVYQNSREGVRFLVPEGWRQTASAMLPPGKLNQATRLVIYKLQGSSLELMCFDAGETDDLRKFFGQPSQGAKQWTPQGEEESLSINDVAAHRNTFNGQVQGKPMIKQVTTFDRGQRVYSFVAVYPQSDEKAGQEIRRAVGSALWE